MLNRHVPLVVCLSLFSGAVLAQNPGTGYAIQYSSSASGQFNIYPENATSLANAALSNTGPSGANQVVAKPDGSKFYIVGSGGVDSIDPGFTTPRAINGMAGTIGRAVISPDGRFLLIPSQQTNGASSVYILNTSNDTVVQNPTISGNVIGMVVSRDSSTVWILGESGGGQGATFLVNFNLSTLAEPPLGQLNLKDPTSGNPLAGAATGISISPLGLLYITAQNQILQADPAALLGCFANSTAALECTALTLSQGIAATPGPLVFTTDGAFAYFVNLTPLTGGRSIYRLALPSLTSTFFISTEAFDGIFVAGANRIFAHSAGDTTLWDVAPDLSAVTVSSLSNVLPAANVNAIAISSELPSAQYLFAVAGGSSLTSVYRVNLSSNQVNSQVASSLGPGPLQFVLVPASSNPPGFSPPLTYNATQTVQPGTASTPLIARILDQNGDPAFAATGTFTGDTSLRFNPASPISNADGYIQTIVTVGQTPGVYPVTLTVGSGTNVNTATFTLTVPGANGGNPGGPNNGPNQLSIVGGNGLLFQSNNLNLGNPNAAPTVLLVDLNGNPMPNQQVTFTLSNTFLGSLGGSGSSASVTTDTNGLASVVFYPAAPPQNVPFASTNITATAINSSGQTLGSVTFVETVFQLSFDGSGGITVRLPPTANNPFALAGGEGDVIPQAFTEYVVATAFGGGLPVPNIGVRIADPNNPDLPGPGTCKGNPLSDQTGTIHCDFVPACIASVSNNPPPVTLGFTIEIGEFYQQQGDSVTITPGSTQTLTIPANGGNNQSGRAGTALTSPLIVKVADQCGIAIPGVNVTWHLTAGSATLSAGTSTTVAGGTASTRVTLGANPGTVQITATINGNTTVTFTETTTATIGNFRNSGGGGQSTVQNTAFPQPVVFTVTDNNNNPLPGLTVNFSVTSGSASIGVTTATTNAQGQASVSVTAGNTPGSVTITATLGSLTATASLTVNAQGPGVNAANFVNAASLQQGLVPCGLATVTGTGLVPGITGVVSGNTLGIGPLPYTLQGVSISVNTIPAPILAVSNQNGVQQVNFQTPCEVTTGSGTVTVQVNSAITTVTGVSIYPTQPGIFTYAGPGGISYGWVINAADGSYLTPSNLARAGGTYYLVATAMGQTVPPATTNAAGTGSQTIPVSQVVLAIDNIGVPVTSVQYLEGAVGEYVITFTIPTVANGQPFPVGTNFPISLGGITSTGQTIFDTASVALPGVH